MARLQREEHHRSRHRRRARLISGKFGRVVGSVLTSHPPAKDEPTAGVIKGVRGRRPRRTAVIQPPLLSGLALRTDRLAFAAGFGFRDVEGGFLVEPDRLAINLASFPTSFV